MALAFTAGELITSINRMVRTFKEQNVAGPYTVEMERETADVLAREFTNDRLPDGVSQFRVGEAVVTVID